MLLFVSCGVGFVLGGWGCGAVFGGGAGFGGGVVQVVVLLLLPLNVVIVVITMTLFSVLLSFIVLFPPLCKFTIAPTFQIAIYGRNFCVSAKDAFFLLLRNVLR